MIQFSDTSQRSILFCSQVLVSIARLRSLFLNPPCRSSANGKAAKLTANQSRGGALYFSPNRPRYIAHNSLLQSSAGLVQWGSNGVCAIEAILELCERPTAALFSSRAVSGGKGLLNNLWCCIGFIQLKGLNKKIEVLKNEIVECTGGTSCLTNS